VIISGYVSPLWQQNCNAAELMSAGISFHQLMSIHTKQSAV